MDKSSQKTKPVAVSPAGFSVSRRDITDFIIGTLGFFMGRVVVFGDINLLGIAYLSTFFLEGKRFYIAAFFTLIGIMTRYTLAEALAYIICVLTMCVLNLLFSKRAGRNPFLFQCVGAGALLACSGLVVAFVNGGYAFYILMAVLQGLLTFSLAFIIKKGMRILHGKTKKRSLTNEDLISLAIIAGGLIAGSADIYISNVSLKYYFCSLIVMVMGSQGGLSVGATAGVLLGFLLRLAGYGEANYAVILSVAGLIAGGMKALAKQWIAAGFALGCIVIAAYMQRELIDIEFLFSILFAGITFILLPDKMTFNLSAAINPALDNSENYTNKLKELTTDKLHGFARAFQRLSKTFSGLSEKRTSLTQKDVSNLIDDAAAKTCIHCEKRDLCWEENFYNTYQTVFSMLNACEKKGRIEESDISEEFRAVCVNVSGFSETVHKVFELYKTNLIWHNRIIESRELVSEQLNGVSKVIGNIADDLDMAVTFKEDLEKTVIEELSKHKIEVTRVIVLENKLGKYEVSVSHKPCYNKALCAKAILPVINKTLGRRMKRDEKTCLVTKERGKTVCKLGLVEEQQYCLTSAVARTAKDGGKESGDSYSFMELKNGQCLLALSDGMGTGRKAMEESAAAIDLLEEFVETGFDKDTAVKMINSVLLLKFNDESFSTLDICSVDLYSGEAEFMKIGASSTFLVRNGEVAVIRSWSLPVGILNNVDLDITKKQLKDGDMLVMVTDGVLDAAEKDEDNENWIADTLRQMTAKNPQDVADMLIAEAKSRSGGAAKDDMTVLAARFWEK